VGNPKILKNNSTQSDRLNPETSRNQNLRRPLIICCKPEATRHTKLTRSPRCNVKCRPYIGTSRKKLLRNQLWGENPVLEKDLRRL